MNYSRRQLFVESRGSARSPTIEFGGSRFRWPDAFHLYGDEDYNWMIRCASSKMIPGTSHPTLVSATRRRTYSNEWRIPQAFHVARDFACAIAV